MPADKVSLTPTSSTTTSTSCPRERCFTAAGGDTTRLQFVKRETAREAPAGGPGADAAG